MRGLAAWRSFAVAGAVVSAAGAGAQQPPAADARQALVTVSVTPDTVAIGEPFTVRIRVRAPKVASIRFPDVPEPANAVEAVDPRAVDEGPPGDVLDRTARYAFVAWDVGLRGPAFGPVVVTVGGQARRFELGSPAVHVRRTLPADTSEQVPRDARAPVPLPGRLWQYLVLGVVAVAGVAWYFWRRARRRRGGVPGPIADAWDEARTAFDVLGGLRLHEAGEPGRHVIAHVDVLRTYLERRFPPVSTALGAGAASAALAAIDFPLPVHRVSDLLDRDAALRFAHDGVTADDAAALAAEARDLVLQVQLGHEARLRAMERPPRPRRR